MAKLRKMLGDIHSLECTAMMRLIETQSEATLICWALGFVQESIAGIYCKKAADCQRLCVILDACLKTALQSLPGKTMKPLIKEANQIARETEDPIAQAAARAIAAACGTLTTPTTALGFVFYAAAAWIYDQSSDFTAEETDALTRQFWRQAHASLSAQAIQDEPHPAKIQWHC